MRLNELHTTSSTVGSVSVESSLELRSAELQLNSSTFGETLTQNKNILNIQARAFPAGGFEGWVRGEPLELEVWRRIVGKIPEHNVTQLSDTEFLMP